MNILSDILNESWSRGLAVARAEQQIDRRPRRDGTFGYDEFNPPVMGEKVWVWHGKIWRRARFAGISDGTGRWRIRLIPGRGLVWIAPDNGDVFVAPRSGD